MSGNHQLLGQVDLSTQRMMELAAQHGATVPLQPPAGSKPGNYGSLQVRHASSLNSHLEQHTC